MAETWNIYHREREYAKNLGDPVIGTVSAETKEEAEREASRQFNLPTGAWAHRDEKTLTPREIATEVRELHAHFQDLTKQYEQEPARRAEIREEMQPIVNRENQLREAYGTKLSQEIAQDQLPTQQRGIGY